MAAALIALSAIAPAFARDALTVGLQLEPPTLDPTSGAGAPIDEVTYGTIFETLVRLDATALPHPWLATGWATACDGLSWTFTLRPNVRFSDGTPFDVRAVAFALGRATAPGSTNAQAEALRNIVGADRLGPLTVRLRLRSPDAGLLALLSRGDAAMISPKAASSLATTPIGTGPFRLASWIRGDRITLVRNDGYWGARPSLARLTFRFIADPSAAEAAIRAHDVDLFTDFPAPEAMARLARAPGLKVAIGPTEGEVILALNNARGPFRDVRVRRAIATALDRRAIIDGAMFGYGTPIGSHYPPQGPGYVDLTQRWPHGPVAARQLLAEAGYPDGFDTTLQLPPPSYARRTGEVIAAQLRVVGVRVRIEPVEWAQWLDRVYSRHAYDMSVIAHVEPADYDIYGRPDYYFGYDGRVVRGLLDRLRRADAPAERNAVLGAIQRRLADDAANGFLFEFPRLGVQDARLSDLWVNTPNQAVDYATARFAGGDGEPTRNVAPSLPWLRLSAVFLMLLVGWGAWRLGPARFAGRLAVLAGTLIAASLIVFLLLQVLPGDPAAFMMGLEASPRALAALRTELGLGGSALSRYFGWIGGLAQGDLGTSYTYRVPVAGLIGERLALSVPLAGLASLVSIGVGLPLALAAARWRGRWPDRVVAVASGVGIAVPAFWLAILLVFGFSLSLRWFAAGGFPGWDGGAGPALAALVLPSLALGLPQAAIVARAARAALGEALDAPHILTARAKGLREGAILRRHALPNAAAPILAIIGLQFPFLLAGSVIVENVFYLPGIGRLVLQAIAQRDLVVVQAAVLLLAAAVVVTSFLVDLAQAAIDPRLRA